MFAQLAHQQELRLCARVCTRVCWDVHLAHTGGYNPSHLWQGMGLGWLGEKAHAQSEGVKQE